ncbi:hypothetical protein AB0B88_20945 [Micromonospora haikouensis]|uniref:hypothetical protein n=1 Tax=Micromonospora haikouensis TaxID=686309 RepID=UPI0033D8F8FF
MEPPGEDDHDHPPAARTPPASGAPTVAAAFAAAWARPDLTAQQWWEQIAPLCEPAFGRTLRTVDPARVPATRITGRPVAVQPPKDGRATYRVATDAGTLSVALAAIDGRWVAVDNDFVRTVR